VFAGISASIAHQSTLVIIIGGLPMRRVVPLVLMSLPFLSIGFISVLSAQDKDKPKYTIKEVMKEHGKGKTKDKIIDGSASADEKKKMVEMYTELAKNKPPKGEADNWKKLTDALVKATKDVESGKDGAVDEYKKATNCKACHENHK
jgi:hypothetical protein